ncbi:geranylgeranylglyceryl/heptaprenylglyceryl phosphate synthase [Flavobacterium sp. CYK-4]|uniref:geranylgeranylglyceryl/heptaprenylglyceryl phosphate synthase n=1 Tax=Flavobacterium lotistagni TaxID=2709660 RepID=UPI00140C7A14|nr:geranylgeranylglyceryl/heptaprenylglyceryl phosphate synthase [Flavobacterium lotistagni]NHM05912.1 geranylgeranylglyceryl/heptaprenylglyceryl phosphate synthase [Flavobacterium lotistagni]
MKNLYNEILKAKTQSQKLLAILLDPDKINLDALDLLLQKINQSPATHIFVGGSIVKTDILEELIIQIKENCNLPIVLFPGDSSQICDKADAILLLSLLSGRNPDYLIGHQVAAVPKLKKTKLEIIPTAYLLIESGHQTAVARVSQTQPMDQSDIEAILHTAQAGEMLGKKLIYLEAGSGAKNPIPTTIIQTVSKNTQIPLIVGGGIRSIQGIQKAHEAGADMVVIGTAFENDNDFFNS